MLEAVQKERTMLSEKEIQRIQEEERKKVETFETFNTQDKEKATKKRICIKQEPTTSSSSGSVFNLEEVIDLTLD